ncbi:hypothetical protein ACQVTU_33270 [Bacillus cereus]|nr:MULTISPECIES: hypothetical protein [Bacillus cereus group]MDA2164196.1 hypothetical protein [Bacillus cereus group sp. Bc252]MED3468324.1 hypothetical protein [Bacillus thuringiensis]HDR3897038.1 hypothetical protein [Bacillus cereus]
MHGFVHIGVPSNIHTTLLYTDPSISKIKTSNGLEYDPCDYYPYSDKAF